VADGLAITWRAREPPLEVAGLVAIGDARRRLFERLAPLDDGALARWVGVATVDAWVIVGDALPWVAELTWLGRAPGAPTLLVPTRLAPSPPARVIAHALARRGARGDVALFGERPRVVSLDEARPLARARLAASLGP
jgi:hypothetical protein